MIAGRQVRSSQNTAGRALAGAPRQVRVSENKRRERPWLDVPPGYAYSALEWYIEWYLTRRGVEPNRRRYRLGLDFERQETVGTPGVNVRGFSRQDFILIRERVCLDPYTTFTHPDPILDLRKRQALKRAGYTLVFLYGPQLEADPGPLIELARQGFDISPQGARLGGGR